jgi:hypothetical protein
MLLLRGHTTNIHQHILITLLTKTESAAAVRKNIVDTILHLLQRIITIIIHNTADTTATAIEITVILIDIPVIILVAVAVAVDRKVQQVHKPVTLY